MARAATHYVLQEAPVELKESQTERDRGNEQKFEIAAPLESLSLVQLSEKLHPVTRELLRSCRSC